MYEGHARRGKQRARHDKQPLLVDHQNLKLRDMLNPAFGIEHFPVKKRERFLSPEERQRGSRSRLGAGNGGQSASTRP